MAYGLPARGQQNWDDELNNSIEALRADVESSVSKADVAASDAAYARNRADEVHTAVIGGTDAAVSGFINDDTSATKASLSATYAAVVGIGPASGTNDTAHINALLSANPGKIVRGTPGESYKISAPLILKSGTTLDMTGCTVTLLPGSACRMVQNAALSGTGARDTDVHVTGGYWDRGAVAGGAGNDAHSFVFHRADRASFRDMRFNATGAIKYAFYGVDVNDFAAERLYIDSTSDGVHITGPAARITVRDISGKGDDDIVSFTGRDYTTFEMTAGGGNISDILVERIVCRGGLDPNTVKLLPGQGMTLARAVVRNISGSPATSAVVLYNDTVQTSTTGGTIDGCVIDGVTGTPGQRYVNVAHPDVRGLVVRNVAVTANVTRAISFSGGTGAVITDAIVDGVFASEAMEQSILHVGSPTTINRLTVNNISARSASGKLTILLNSDGNIGNLQLSNITQVFGYGGLVIAGGTCPLVSINGYHSTASNSLVRISANVPVEIHATGITAYPPSLVTVLGETASVVFRAGTIVESANAQLARTATQALRAIGAGARVDAGILTPVAGDIVTNTNDARGYGTGPVVSNGTLWKNLYTGTAA